MEKLQCKYSHRKAILSHFAVLRERETQAHNSLVLTREFRNKKNSQFLNVNLIFLFQLLRMRFSYSERLTKHAKEEKKQKRIVQSEAIFKGLPFIVELLQKLPLSRAHLVLMLIAVLRPCKV
jgi:hypothetical protein